jgi:transposase
MSGDSQERSFAVVAETRRKWSRAEKEAMVAETAGASVSSVARKHGVASSLLFRWRRGKDIGSKAMNPRAGVAFVPVALPAPSASHAPMPAMNGGLIEIELVSGRRIRVDASVDAGALKRVIAVLDER